VKESVSTPAEIQEKPQKRSRVTLYTVVGLIVAASIFSSGWLLGAGKISFQNSNLLPVSIDTRQAPRDGINELFQQLLDNFDGELTDQQLLDGQKSGLVSSTGDPYTEYLTAQETVQFNEGLNGTFEGIGAELGKEGNFVIIVSPIKGTPADRAGLQPGDIITEIDGESAANISITEAVTRIRGPKGEEVVLTIIRNGQEISVSIIRDTISIASVEWEKRGDTGIISIGRFGEDTALLTRQAAQELKGQGIKNVILDVRGNPGGLLDASVEVSSVWLPKGSTVLEEKRNGVVVQTFKTSGQPILAGMPTVVLINGGSASASEIVAGALHDNKAAVLVGTKTFGKGSVQRLIPLQNGGSLKVTIARWFTPEGKNIDKEGITPDVEVDISSENTDAGSDPQLDRAIDYLRRN
jgi:carboxyl-terminal processing protease